MADQARKDDGEKPRWDLLPAGPVAEVVEVLTHGAARYGDRNYLRGMRYGRLFAAAMRHLWAWWRGAHADPDTGCSHLAHAACCVLMLMDLQERGIPEDDRHAGRQA